MGLDIDLNPFDDPGGPLEINLSDGPDLLDVDLLDVDLNPLDSGEALEIDLLADDTIDTIVTIAAAATGNPIIMAGAETALTYAQTGDIEDALSSGGVKLLTAGLAGAADNLVGDTVSSAVDTVAGEVLSEATTEAVSGAITEGGVAAISAAITGDDVGTAFLEAAVGSAASSAVDGLGIREVNIFEGVDVTDIDAVINAVQNVADVDFAEIKEVTGIDIDALEAANRAKAAAEEKLAAAQAKLAEAQAKLEETRRRIAEEEATRAEAAAAAAAEEEAAAAAAAAETARKAAAAEAAQITANNAIAAAEEATNTAFNSLSTTAQSIVSTAVQAVDTVIDTAGAMTGADLSNLSAASQNVIVEAAANATAELITTGEITSTSLADAVATAAANTKIVTNALEALETNNEVIDTFVAESVVAATSTAVQNGDVGAAIGSVADKVALDALAAAIDDTKVGDVINNTVDSITGNDQIAREAAIKVDNAADVYEATYNDLQTLVNERKRLFDAANLAVNEYDLFRDGPSQIAAETARQAFLDFDATFNDKYNTLSDSAISLKADYDSASAAYTSSLSALATSQDRLADDLKPATDSITQLTATSINPNLNPDIVTRVMGLPENISAYDAYIANQTAVKEAVIDNAVQTFFVESSGFGESDIKSETTSGVTVTPIAGIDVDSVTPTLGGPAAIETTPTIDTDKDSISLEDQITPALFELLGYDKNFKPEEVVGNPLSFDDLIKLNSLGENVNQRDLAFAIDTLNKKRGNIGVTLPVSEGVFDLGGGNSTETLEYEEDGKIYTIFPTGMILEDTDGDGRADKQVSTPKHMEIMQKLQSKGINFDEAAETGTTNVLAPILTALTQSLGMSVQGFADATDMSIEKVVEAFKDTNGNPIGTLYALVDRSTLSSLEIISNLQEAFGDSETPAAFDNVITYLRAGAEANVNITPQVNQDYDFSVFGDLADPVSGVAFDIAEGIRKNIPEEFQNRMSANTLVGDAADLFAGTIQTADGKSFFDALKAS